MRGLMIDAARTPETLEEYVRFIDFAAERGINTILFRIADNHGIAVRLERVKGLLELQRVYSKKDLRSLSIYASSKGLDLIPEVESFGHSRYITASPDYAHLDDIDPDASNHFSGLCPVNPGTLELMREIYTEITDIFTSEYLHGGCDEVNWGGSELSKRALAEKTRHEIWADYVNALNQSANSLGKELIVWGDHLLRKKPGILKKIDRNVILMDWDYSTLDPAPLRKHALRAMRLGFRVIGAPALGWCARGARVGRSQLYNIDAYAEAYRQPRRKESLGVVVTNWCPWRFPAGSNWDGLAYAAFALRDGPTSARQTAFRDFVETFYGSTWNDSWAEAFFLAYAVPEPSRGCANPWEGPFGPVPWCDNESLKVAVAEGRTDFPPVDGLLGKLLRLEKTVRKNNDYFKSFMLAFEYIAHANWRASEVALKPSPDQASELITRIARRDQLMLRAIQDNWNRCRPAPKDGVEIPGSHETKMMLHRIGLAARYTSELAAEPARFAKMLCG